MKKLTFFWLVILMTMPVRAQFALKGGISFNKNEISSYVLTGQYYQDLLIVSGDLFIPTQKYEKVSGGARIGLGLGNYLLRFGGDMGAKYESNHWRIGYGVEGNLRLYRQIGVFVRWAKTYPIYNKCGHNVVFWRRGRSEFFVGVVIDLSIKKCY